MTGFKHSAFISYAHDADQALAPRLRIALRQIGRSWLSKPRLDIFLDHGGLGATPDLRKELLSHVQGSDFLIILLSPEAVASRWVDDEIAHYMKDHEVEKLVFVVTKWKPHDPSAKLAKFDWRSGDLPPALQGRLRAEPSLVDLRGFGERTATLLNRRFREEVAKIAAPLLGRSPQEVMRKDVRQRRFSALSSVAGVGVIAALAGGAFRQVQRTAAEGRNRLILTLAKESEDPTRQAVLLREVRLPLPEEWDRAVEIVLGKRLAESIEEHPGEVDSVAFSPDGRKIASGSADHLARLWNADGTGQPIRLAGHKDRVRLVVFSETNGKLMTASDDRIQVWNVDGTGPPIEIRGPAAGFSTAAFSRDGTRIATGDRDHTLTIWNLRKRDAESKTVGREWGSGRITALAFNRQGGKVAVGDEKGGAWVWNVDASGPPIALRGHQRAVFATAFSPTGNTIATGSVDVTAIVWDASGGRPRFTLAHEGPVLQTLFSPDGTKIGTGCSDAKARVWSASEVREPVTFGEHTMSVEALAFSPDSAWVVSGSEDHSVWLWAADGSGQPLAFTGHTGRISSVAFSPDGARIVTGSWDHTARVWIVSRWPPPTATEDTRPGGASRVDARTLLWERTTYCLSPEERARMLGDSAERARDEYVRCRRLADVCRAGFESCRRAVIEAYGTDGAAAGPERRG